MIESFFAPLQAFVDPSQRVYWAFLLSALFIAFILYIRQKHTNNFFDFLGGKRAWFSSSAMTDYSWFIIGFWVNFFFVAPHIVSQVDLNMFLVGAFYDIYKPIDLNLSYTTILVTYTVTMIVIFDFTYYLIHKAMHRYKFLWDCHKFHHSATSLNPITLYRTHPVEYIIFGLQKVIVFGLVTSLFIYQFGMVVKPIEFYGVGVGALIFGMVGANLRHSHIEFKYYSWLENIFISPYMHQIHHGSLPKQHHSNFGAIFAIWDNIFGTLTKSKEVEEKIEYGIKGYSHTSIIKSVFLPIINLRKKEI